VQYISSGTLSHVRVGAVSYIGTPLRQLPILSQKVLLCVVNAECDVAELTQLHLSIHQYCFRSTRLLVGHISQSSLWLHGEALF
jgi:hypothetical protein